MDKSTKNLLKKYNQSEFLLVIKQAKKLIKKDPNNIILWNLIGGSYQALNDLKNAKICFSQALKNFPNNHEIFNNLGVIYENSNDEKKAFLNYEKALDIKPKYFDALYNIGSLFLRSNRLEDAKGFLLEALSLNPFSEKALNNLGNVYFKLKEWKLAIECFEKNIKFSDFNERNYLSLAAAYSRFGDFKNALERLHEVQSQNPKSKVALSEKLSISSLICNFSSLCFLHEHKELLLSSSHEDDVHPFTLLAVDDDPEFHYKISSLYAEKFVNSSNASHSAAFIKKLKQSEKLHIGYFSGEFHEHPVARLIVRILELHDRKKFEVSAFSYGPETISKLRTRIEDSVDHFYNVSELSDEDLVAMTREKGIDIAIDLTGYTLFSRMSLFSQRLAPIQINFLGYPGTSGAGFIDFIIGDKNLIHSDNRSFFSENVIFMPNQYQPQDDTIILSPNSPTRQDLGLPETEFIFCAINNSYKINAGVFDVWMNILQEVDESVLWLLESNDWSTENLKKEAQNRNVDPNRLIFAKKVAFETYLKQFQCADLYLDTFIYNAGATASNALYAGLPVLTKPGRGYPARMASSLLRAIDLPELIANNVEEYKTKAIELANSPEKLQALKNKLHNNKKSAPLFNSELFTRNLEKGLIEAYQMNVKNTKLEDIYL